jgi:hypothetical protein
LGDTPLSDIVDHRPRVRSSRGPWGRGAPRSHAAIVGVRVLDSGPERGVEAAWAALHYYAQRDGVLFQADGVGFDEGEELILPVT